MPFTCQATIEPSQLRHGSIIFDQWLEEAWDRFVPAGTAFLRGHDADGNCIVKLTGPGFLSTKPKLKAGDAIRAGMIVAYFAANGEDIPYGQPDCSIEYE
jgi:hypothetical protein